MRRLSVLIDALVIFFFQAEDGIRDHCVTGVQTCALPISSSSQVSTAMVEISGGADHQRSELGAMGTGLEELRSEERRVGKECRSRGSPYREKRDQEEGEHDGGHGGRAVSGGPGVRSASEQ